VVQIIRFSHTERVGIDRSFTEWFGTTSLGGMQGMIPPAKQLKNRKQYLRRSGICTSMCGMLASWFALQTSLS
jgi:hypothetical protein